MSESLSTEYDPSFDFESLRWLRQGKGGRNLRDSPDISILLRPSYCAHLSAEVCFKGDKKFSKDIFSSDAREKRTCK